MTRLLRSALYSLVVSASLLCVDGSEATAAPPCGTVLTSYKGVDAFSNGNEHSGDESCVSERRGTYGWRYQCVEFVKRFYSQYVGLDTSDWWGNASDFYGNASSFDLLSYPNGSATPPAPDDILVFSGGGFGHVAIITGVSGNAVTLIEQNWSASGTATIQLNVSNGRYTFSPRAGRRPFAVMGWLRSPAAPPPPPTPVLPTLRDDFYQVSQGGTLVAPSPGPPAIAGIFDNDTIPTGIPSVFFSNTPPGFADLGNGAFSYSPPTGVTGPASFSYRVPTVLGLSAPATVTIQIIAPPPPPPAPPVAVDDLQYSVSQGGSLTVPAPGVLANDTRPLGSTVEFLLPLPAGVTTTSPDGSFSIDLSGDPTFTGPLTFGYLVRAGSLVSNIASVSVTVSSAPAPRLSSSDWTLRPTPTNPGARSTHAMAYDVARRQTVLFGGHANRLPPTDLNDTWLWDGLNWAQALPASSPSPRAFHVMSYDEVRGEVVLFGGMDTISNIRLNDTWVWNGSDWTQKFPAQSPPVRYGPSMAYDAFRHETVLFGGEDNGALLADTWVWDGTNWTQRHSAHVPPGRYSAAMSYDRVRREIVLFGGGINFTYTDDTWTWDGASWAQRAVASPPTARAGHAMVFDERTGYVLMFGGEETTARYAVDTQIWDGTAWRPLSPSGMPGGRLFPAIAYDAARQESVMFGGSPWNTSDGTSTWVWRYTGSIYWSGTAFSCSPEFTELVYIVDDPYRPSWGGYQAAADCNSFDLGGIDWAGGGLSGQDFRIIAPGTGTPEDPQYFGTFHRDPTSGAITVTSGR